MRLTASPPSSYPSPTPTEKVCPAHQECVSDSAPCSAFSTSGDVKGRNLPAPRPALANFRSHCRCRHALARLSNLWVLGDPPRPTVAGGSAGRRCRHAQASGKCWLWGLPASCRPRQAPLSIEKGSSGDQVTIRYTPAARQTAGCKKHACVSFCCTDSISGCHYSL